MKSPQSSKSAPCDRATDRPTPPSRIEQEIKKVVGESAFMHTKVNQWTSNAVVSPSPRSRRANSSLDRPANGTL
jgi:hypothetical protein